MDNLLLSQFFFVNIGWKKMYFSISKGSVVCHRRSSDFHEDMNKNILLEAFSNPSTPPSGREMKLNFKRLEFLEFNKFSKYITTLKTDIYR